MKEAYPVPAIRLQRRSRELVAVMDEIITQYAAQGYVMTVRQLYYQLVARNVVPNTMQSYDNVQQLLTNARLLGMIDWDAIEDRTRAFIHRPSWDSGAEILQSAAQSYHEDQWQDQAYRVFVVVEKEALAGVLERTCHRYDVPLLPARGYPSATALREFAKRRIMGSTQDIVVLHLGDHDPSGIDMSRDLQERLELFSRGRVAIDFQRIALNMDQIEEQKPPANPAKVTDCRYDAYRAQFGESSWELDALTPDYLDKLLSGYIEKYIDAHAWQMRLDRIDDVKLRLSQLADNFDKG